jgi:choline dehydrogenase-like flavoprotein
VPHIVNPVFYLQNLQPTTKTALFYKGNKAPQLADREPIVPCGGTLGGGSSINFMMYTRAQRSDFDSWKTEGWSADEMWPHLKRVRNLNLELWRALVLTEVAGNIPRPWQERTPWLRGPDHRFRRRFQSQNSRRRLYPGGESRGGA